jgi:hypothetical protein
MRLGPPQVPLTALRVPMYMAAQALGARQLQAMRAGGVGGARTYADVGVCCSPQPAPLLLPLLPLLPLLQRAGPAHRCLTAALASGPCRSPAPVHWTMRRPQSSSHLPAPARLNPAPPAGGLQAIPRELTEEEWVQQINDAIIKVAGLHQVLGSDYDTDYLYGPGSASLEGSAGGAGGGRGQRAGGGGQGGRGARAAGSVAASRMMTASAAPAAR